jgi:hypothetical protein
MCVRFEFLFIRVAPSIYRMLHFREQSPTSEHNPNSLLTFD